MNLVIIAAIGKNNELGKDNSLIWRLPKDLKFFKEKTTGKTIVMGRRTFESLPKLLPNRHHVVLTRKGIDNSSVTVYNSIEEFLENYKTEEETYIIGGAMIYKEFIDYTEKMYLTEIDANFEADVFFPKFDKNDWTREELDEVEENGLSYKHVLYRRKS